MNIVGYVFVIGCVSVVSAYLLVLHWESKSTRKFKQESVDSVEQKSVYPSNHLRSRS